MRNRSRGTNPYRATMRACFAGYVVQAAVNNVVPLLLVTFREEFGLTLAQTTVLVSLNFLIQLPVDGLSAAFVDKVGYRFSIVLAHVLAATGFVGLAVLPGGMALLGCGTMPPVLGDPFAGVLVATMLYAASGGLIEVLVSPIVEACPGDEKQAAMSLLHSFYCWGAVGAVLASTGFFSLFGTGSWRVLIVLWALLPLVNGLAFLRVPMASLVGEGERPEDLRGLACSRTFWVAMGLMLCAGAAEMSVAQWASTFAETGLGVSKAVGDLAGPMLFAAAMGASRVLYSRVASRFELSRVLAASGALCVLGHLVVALSPVAALAFAGFGVCGLAVGVLWPGTLSLASAAMPRGGTALFALLALAGDVGCLAGPAVVGSVAGTAGGVLAMGLLAAAAFPVAVVLLAGRLRSGA